MVIAAFLAMIIGGGAVLAFGGRAERLGGLALGGCWLASLAFQTLFGFGGDIPLLITDILYAAGLVALASRFDRSWIWVSLVLQTAVLVGHGLVITLQGEDRFACIAFVNVASFGVLLALVLGTALHAVEVRRPRRRLRGPIGATRAPIAR